MKKSLAMMLALLIALCIVPTVAFAADPVAWIGETGYGTLEEAVNAAASGDTIQLGEGNYTLYGVSSTNTTKGKNLTFIGQGADKTAWNIGAKVPDPTQYGTEYNGDYSLDGAGTITFKDMKLRSGTVDYLGFIRADNTIVEDCIIEGKTFYWGYTSATFKNTTFNCPDGDYALWYYTGNEMSFDNCTFNASGKVINAYREGTSSTAENPLVLNFKNCKVNSSMANKSVLNIKDDNNYYTVNISGANTAEGLKPNDITCSRLFQVEGYADNYNLSGGAGNSKKCQATVTIDGETVWKDGKMVKHAIDTANDKYTDGYKDNAFDVTYSDWSAWNNDTRTRTFTKICKYCGYKEEGTEKETRTVEHHDHYYSDPTPVPVMVIPPKTGDMTIWQSILNFLGIK